MSNRKKGQDSKKTSYSDLDFLVDSRTLYRAQAERSEDPLEKADLYSVVEDLTLEILEKLGPYILKYVLLLKNKLPPKKWNRDIYSFLAIVTGISSKNPADYQHALRDLQILLKEFLVPDNQDSTLTEFSDDRSLNSLPIYSVIVIITIEILNKYRIVYKKGSNERINFMWVYMVDLKFSLKNWIHSSRKDLLHKASITDFYTPDVIGDDREKVQILQEQSNGRYADRVVPGLNFTTFEEFYNTEAFPWNRLTGLQKEALWMKYISRVPERQICEDLRLSVSDLSKLIKNAVLSIKLSAYDPGFKSFRRSFSQESFQ